MTVWYISTSGNDSTGAGTSVSPWKTLVGAYLKASVTDGDTIRHKSGTWSAADAVFDSKGPAQSLTNVSKAVRIDREVGSTVLYTTLTNTAGQRTGELAAGSSPSQDVEGSPTHAVRGHMWRVINPKDGFVIDMRPNDGGFTMTQTGTVPVEVDGLFSSAIYFVNKSGQAGFATAKNPTVRGVTISRFDGNGVMFLNVNGGDVYDCNISHTICGARSENCDGSRVTTSLSVAYTQTNVNNRLATVTLASTAGMTAGNATTPADCLVFGDDFDVDTEVREIAAINGSVVTLSPGPQGRVGLHYPHSSGVQVRTQYGFRYLESHHNDCYGQNDASPTDNNVGGQGMSPQKGTNHHLTWRWYSHDNYGAVADFDYGIDGSAYEPYGLLPGVVCTEGRITGNHGALLESGTDQGQLAVGHTNTGLVFTFNRAWGINDRQSNFGGSPTAPIILARAVPNWIVRRNTLWCTIGPVGNGGWRWVAGGTFGGTLENVTVIENIFAIEYDSALINYTNGSYTTGLTWNRNLLWRVGFASRAGVVKPDSSTHPFSEAGRAAWSAATGYAANDKWATDPQLVDVANGDLRLRSTSPARGMAANGDDIGALEFTSSASSLTTVDAVTLSQVGTRAFTGARTASQSLSFSDVATRQIVGNSKVVSDAVTVADAATRGGSIIGRFPVTNRN